MLKQALIQAPALWLPDPQKTPTLCPQKGRTSFRSVNSKVVTFNSKVEPQPVAYLSKKFDLTARG